MLYMCQFNGGNMVITLKEIKIDRELLKKVENKAKEKNNTENVIINDMIKKGFESDKLEKIKRLKYEPTNPIN